ncbi:MAG TPA: fumarylacetoacetate hydrolase family protein, partial [Stellaceae bacterium]|nr:fumarylacetoacetate hydrolase family protein [Stellaceae bacterium]
MKLCTYAGANGRQIPGVITRDGRGIVSLGDDFADMLALIAAGWRGLETAQRRQAQPGQVVELARTRLLAPIPVPPQFRDFNNHPQHMRDAPKGGAKLRARLEGRPEPSSDQLDFPVPEIYRRLPIFYITNRFSISGPDAEVQRPRYSSYLDYELEMAVVLGRGGRNIAEKDAADHVFGYTIFNDFSARDRQILEMAGRLGPAKGKSFDGSNVLGPWIVTPDELGDPQALNVEVRVNGETRATGTTAN